MANREFFVKDQNGTNLRLGKLKAPLQKKAMDLDRSLNWLVLKMLSEHEFLKSFMENEKNKK